MSPGAAEPEHEEARALLALEAAGSLEDAERALLEAHLRACPSCRAERARLSDAVAAGLAGSLGTVAPTDGARRRLLDSVRADGKPGVLLLTDCLQIDYAGALAPGAERPSEMHVGRAGSLKLLGEDPARGPLARAAGAYLSTMRASPRHAALHILDSHDPAETQTADHFAAFRAHAIAGTPGAEMVEPLRPLARAPGSSRVLLEPAIAEPGVLERAVAAAAGRYAKGGLKVGIVGVWTEMAIYPIAQMMRQIGARVAVADALSTSFDEAVHAGALASMGGDLGVEVLGEVDEMLEWLEVYGPSAASIHRSAGSA